MTRKIHIICIIIGVFSIMLQACSQQSMVPEDEIILHVGDEFTVETKTSEITSVPSTLYWGATTGTSSESTKWSTTSATVSYNQISTGKYQTYSPTNYNYYVSNLDFTAGGDMSVPNNGTDVLAGRTYQSSSTNPSVILNHIFARTGSLTMNTQAGYTISGVSWAIVGKSAINGTAGTYNMRSQSWTASSSTLSEQAISSSSNLYLIPGTYTFKCTYTLTKGDWSYTFTKSADVTIVGGKVNNITGTASGGSASEIVIGLSLTAWSEQNHTPTLS